MRKGVQQTAMAALVANLMATLLTSGPALAADSPSIPADKQTPGHHTYMLVLSWEPEFCYLHGDGHPECAAGDRATSFGATHLTLHGLWPQWSSACSLSAKDNDPTWKDRVLPPLSPAVQSTLAEVMPGIASGLTLHEWQKHGYCSGLSADQYYAQAGAMVKTLGSSKAGTLLANATGKSVTRKALCDALAADFGEAARQSAVLGTGKAAFLTQITFTLKAADDGTTALDAAHLTDSPADQAGRCDKGNPDEALKVAGFK
ncbi:ribonuclease T2 family protein [Nitrospirillum pindoramense]|uniref:Ribonuclease T2 n=1 Tax=Nitrospirillum amazonense TaxID=28077 RepID=A0A560HCN3_9PROT|nr:hypothetical protein [Nitrospirillum amazonense]TWB43871.1 ribonuclease T2 [Nitrospirillum amazonense]